VAGAATAVFTAFFIEAGAAPAAPGFATDPVPGKGGRRMFSIWLASSYQGGNGSAAGRIALVLVALLAVGAFALLQVRARWRRRGASSGPLGQRRYDPSDWRTWPPPSWSGPDHEAPSGHDEKCRPGRPYGYPPGYEPYPRYDPARSPWGVQDEQARDRSLPTPRAGGEAAFRKTTLRA
jgi:hypothetical protein